MIDNEKTFCFFGCEVAEFIFILYILFIMTRMYLVISFKKEDHVGKIQQNNSKSNRFLNVTMDTYAYTIGSDICPSVRSKLHSLLFAIYVFR